MLRRFSLRIGAISLIIGSLCALLGEGLNLWNNDPTQNSWFLPMILAALGTMVLLYGINIYTILSDKINLLGVLSSLLFFLGALVFVVGVIAIDIIVVPMLLSMAHTLTTVINAPGNAAQSAANSASSGLNSLKDGIAGLFGQSASGSDIPSVQIPQVNGLDLINKALASFHLPSFATITHWGHFFFSGGPLAPGCLLLGIALWQTRSFPRLTCYALIGGAGLNLISQIFLSLPILSNITGMLLFASLALLGISMLSPTKMDDLSQSVFSHTGRHARK
ncbi:hypothetical protein [Dictyobacter arantiisoli]|uniref:Uncharacterized protein n=1 Tax=Dictyobacter arantiisoli TaxID=2014874 RepID=A0A5A5TFI8_9CHLR|nr:hypothetical protein [Dictyobacter arantiisoli]GCF09906.1 hypothetical protein KDI_34700 [Dictyobacter arantiisoli]